MLQAELGRSGKIHPRYKLEENRGASLKNYSCMLCGYIYDPLLGDADGGIAPGTAFEDLPEDWVCPVCSASKDQFEPVEE
jgi:rubredoxin